jgi:uncharacterized LabA/DUF88 family protein
MAGRVAVFFDYQNVYRRARGAFALEDEPGNRGHVNPLALAEVIVQQGLPDRYLSEVRVYRGQPDATKDPRGYTAATRQVAAWAKLPKVKVITRTLRYPPNWPNCLERPQEKGIDVALAVDFVTSAINGAYDIGIVMSVDTDLKPALEAVARINSNYHPRCEVAAWSPTKKGAYGRRLSIDNANLWCHWLDKSVFDSVADTKNYLSVRP